MSFTPYFARLELKQGKKVLWSSGTSSGAPFLVDDGNLQQQVNAAQVPQTNFFERVKIDPLVIDPKYSQGFGVWTLGLSGIQVTSTTPPGRADDPMEAAEEQQQNAKQANAKGCNK